MIKKTIAALVLLLFPLSMMAQTEMISLARKVNNHIMAKWPDPRKDIIGRKRWTSNLWTRAVYYEGLMALYSIDRNEKYLEYTDTWARYHGWTARRGIKATNADNQCCQQIYLERFRMAGDTTMINRVKENLDNQISTGHVDYWTWIDAIQMAMPVYSMYYNITGDTRYLDYAMSAYRWTRNECGGGLFNTDSGLWWRDKDYVPPYKEKDGNNCYWSRGNGWVYAALVRVMSDLIAMPKNSDNGKEFSELLSDFKAMSKALKDCQRRDGFWNVSLQSPATYGGPEMTGTALFLYGMSWGIRNGFLKAEEYREVCDKAWKALASCVHHDGFLAYNQGTGKDPSAGQPVTFTSMPDFEDYGTGCFLLGAVEYHKLSTANQGVASWPMVSQNARPGTRWWWLGSAVDKENLKWSLGEYAKAGIGAVEITPLYGVKGNDANDIPFLSPKWMEMLESVHDIAGKENIAVDMNCGTGWPFGGPQVTIEEAACKAVFVDTLITGNTVNMNEITLSPSGKDREYAKEICIKAFREAPQLWRVIAVFEVPTRQKVKRAAPGGEGWVVNHFDSLAVAHYLARFDTAFNNSHVAWPRTFFNDSYEVYGANWTPGLLNIFREKKGYALEDYLPELLGYKDDGGKVLADYRETLADLLYENFTKQWVKWAHNHGVKVRNQAHGSPANLLDLYGEVDIPEIEGFGLTDFGIRGLRKDNGFTRPNFSDVSMLKYASSAAHVTGKRLTSSETFTWLTEHFRTSLSQMKPDLDLMFSCGVNNVFFHGTCYSPKDDPWPGWKFYASVDMSPTNSIWRDAPYLMKYIERCQSFLQMGEPDNDFLVLLPVKDMWRKRLKKGAEGLLMMFDIHSIGNTSPEFRKSVVTLDSLGYGCDYISERQLKEVKVADGCLVTKAGQRYKALVIPSAMTMDDSLRELLKPFKNFIVVGENDEEMARYARPEQARRELGLRVIRRSNDEGYHYFLANLTNHDIDAHISLSTACEAALWYDAMSGKVSKARFNNGLLHVALRSGESRILKTFISTPGGLLPNEENHSVSFDSLHIKKAWELKFIDSVPHSEQTFVLSEPRTWENLGESFKTLMGTGVYTTSFKLKKEHLLSDIRINLGDVRESARVYINDHLIGCAWAAPFVLDVPNEILVNGKNTLRIEVTNLPANLISEYDRISVPWRKMKEINVVDINYKKTTYADWKPMPSGLNSAVFLEISKQKDR